VRTSLVERATSVLVSSLLLASCHAERPKTAAPTPSGPAQSVATAAVTRVDGADATVPGTVRARQRAALSSRIPASLLALPYREGERVEAGAVLVRLDDTALRSALAATEAGLKGAQAERLRMESLLKKDAATARELDEASSRAAAAQAAWEAAKDSLAYAVLRAPFAGRVGSRPVNIGDVVAPGQTLIELEGEDGYEVVATLDADLAAAARPGLALRAEVDGVATPLSATVRAVSPAGDVATHRFEVRADLPPAAGLRSGLFVRLLLPSQTRASRLSLPSRAIFERGGLSGVFVVAEGKARLRWIAVGAAAGGLTEVRAGLDAGERVVLDPRGLEDGAAVTEAR
jgi:RND family efflux transporter MFP subunit